MHALSLVLLVGIASGHALDDPPRIIGGEVDDPPHSIPWQALLVNKIGGLQCGGTIVHERFVISAAHCANYLFNLNVIGGASTRCKHDAQGNEVAVIEPTQQIKQVVKIHRTSGDIEYNRTHLYNDIVILELDSPFQLNENVTKAALPINAVSEGTNVTVSGWGSTSNDPSAPASCVLKFLQLPIVSFETCQKSYNYLISSQICAGFAEGGQDSCQGDSGGPLVERNGKNATLVRIVSDGKECALPNFYGIYTNVFSYLDWINSVIGKCSMK